MRIHLVLTLLFSLCGSSILSSTAQDKPLLSRSLIKGIDHIPIVVNDPDSVAKVYKRLGFAIKPGRKHPNGIWNQHIKFSDGTELELITASRATDELSTAYYSWLKTGEGPLYFGLFTSNISALAKQLDGFRPYEQEGNSITFPAKDLLHPLFFGTRNQSPTDKPEHFAHANTAQSLIGLWLATDSIATYRALFKQLAVPVIVKKMHTPLLNGDAPVATFATGELVLLPASFRTIPGHQVIGATVRVANISAVKAQLKKAGIQPFDIKTRNSIFLSPEITHGIWLEFRQ